MKKVFALISSLIILALLAVPAFAAEPAADANLYVTIANKGFLVVTQEIITVKDINEDGALTVDEALFAAHEAKYNGGSAAGYGSEKTQYGVSVTMLWGDTSGSFGCYLNNQPVLSLADKVKNGDYINAFVYSDLDSWSDQYCFFDKNTFSAERGEKIALTLFGAGYDAEWNPVTLPVEGATITLNGEKTEYKTDSEGRAEITFNKEGTHVIGAVSERATLVPPVSVALVTNKTRGEAEELLKGITDFKIPSGNIQSYISETLSKEAGVGAEWYMLALSQQGSYDFSSYERELLGYLAENEVSSASTRLKYALCLAAVGSTDGYIEQTLKDSVGKQGVMSLVFGLHLLNNGYEGGEYTKASLIEELLSLQLSDGGFALSGKQSDNDATAMAIQALAPHYQSNAVVKAAVDKALELLSGRQKPGGDYVSYGVTNPESTAQVLLALASLGIDFAVDERFIKNGNTLLDGIKKYRLAEGGFSHTEGGEGSVAATEQVFCALVGYLRLLDGKTPFYILDNVKHGVENQPDASEASATGGSGSELEKQEPLGYKPRVIGIIALLGALSALVLLLLKKRNYKNFIAIILIVAIGITVVLVTDFRSAEDYYNGQDTPKENVIGKVTMTVRCDTIVGKSDSEYIPANGVILAVTEFDIAEGETAYDILVEATKKHNLQMENSGGEDMAYIIGINYLYEFDFGELSGWVYRVNGTQPSVSCGEYKLSDGDVIEWHYSLDLGKFSEQ